MITTSRSPGIADAELDRSLQHS